MIKALPTTYNGVQFKSRTEARWAAYFDLMGVEWRYEDEAYELPSGGYLPDFYLPKHDVFAEVKGDDGFDLKAIRKVLELSDMTRRHVLCLDGPPATTVYLKVGALVSSVPVVGDELGGVMWYPNVYGEFVPLNARKSYFRNGTFWAGDSTPYVGYGIQWMRRSHVTRIQLWGGDYSDEAELVRRAITTRSGDLIVLGSRS